MRKGRLAVVFLGSIFPKTLKMHCQVKSLLNLYTYLRIHCNYLTYLFLITHTDCLLFLPHHVVYRAQNSARPERSKSVQNEELTGQTSNVAFMFVFTFTVKIRKKVWNIYTNHSSFIWRKVVRGRRVTLPAESTLPSVRIQQKILPRLTKLTAGRLSPEFIQTIIDSTIADVQHNFVSLSQTPILAPFSFSITTLAHALWIYIWPSWPG